MVRGQFFRCQPAPASRGSPAVRCEHESAYDSFNSSMNLLCTVDVEITAVSARTVRTSSGHECTPPAVDPYTRSMPLSLFAPPNFEKETLCPRKEVYSVVRTSPLNWDAALNNKIIAHLEASGKAQRKAKKVREQSYQTGGAYLEKLVVPRKSRQRGGSRRGKSLSTAEIWVWCCCAGLRSAFQQRDLHCMPRGQIRCDIDATSH
jgi:hypothetical protein